MVGRPVVTRETLVRPQPSQPRNTCPDRLTVEDAGLSHRKRGFDSRSGYCLTARLRTRLETRPGCLPGEAGSIPVEGVPSRRSSVVSTTLLPWGTGVRILPARLRRTASSEPPGCEPGKQGATPWRRLDLRRRAGWAKRRSDTAVERGSIPRSSTSGRRQGRVRIHLERASGGRPAPDYSSGCGGEGLPRRSWEPEIAGSTPASQTSARAR